MGDNSFGLSSLSGRFFQEYEYIVGPDIISMVHYVFDGNSLPKFVTHTNLVFIPKKANVKTFIDLKPINLSNFVNKILSKIIHDRLEILLPKLMSTN